MRQLVDVEAVRKAASHPNFANEALRWARSMNWQSAAAPHRNSDMCEQTRSGGATPKECGFNSVAMSCENA